MAVQSKHLPQNIAQPEYLGDPGTWTERGPVGWVEPFPNPPWIGTTEIFTESAGLAQIRTLIYHQSVITPNGLNQTYTPPSMGIIDQWGQPVSPDVQDVQFFGSGG